MAKGRQARILGKRMVINLNTKGGVRKSPGSNRISKCVAREMAGRKFGNRAAQRAAFSEAATQCRTRSFSRQGALTPREAYEVHRRTGSVMRG